MKITIVGHLSHNSATGDMGTKKVAFHIARELSRRHEVQTIEVKDIRSWMKIRAFSPEIIQVILGPSTPGFIVAKVLSLYSRKAKVVMSAPNPSYLRLRRLIPLLKPDLILPQSYQSERLFTKLGLRTQFLPNGVETEKFIPMDKPKLRQKYGIDIANFVILHVGPIIKERSIQLFQKLQRGENQVIIIGRKPVQRHVYSELTGSGCLIFLDYMEHIEEIYALSDVYVFPTIDKLACIETPLSVLEAMSCNLPVITTPFGALPRIFEEDDSFFFAHTEADFLNAMNRIKKGDLPVKTREKVLSYSWENIIVKLEQIYEQLTI